MSSKNTILSLSLLFTGCVVVTQDHGSNIEPSLIAPGHEVSGSTAHDRAMETEIEGDKLLCYSATGNVEAVKGFKSLVAPLAIFEEKKPPH